MKKESNIKIISQELFYVLTVVLIIFFVIELLFPGMVLAYININWVLIFWVINVILILVLTKKL